MATINAKVGAGETAEIVVCPHLFTYDEQLLLWGGRVLDAASLDEVFTVRH